MRQRRSFPRLWRISKAAVVGIVVLAAIVVVTAAAPLISPNSPTDQDITVALRAPSWLDGGAAGHVLGTDEVGRDLLSRVIYGGRISLAVAGAAVLVSSVFGVAVGLVTGFYRGWLDEILMTVADIQLAFPFILVALAIIAAVGPSLTNTVLVLGLTGWVAFARLVRSEVLSLREREFIEASRAVGGAELTILTRHILPQVIAPVIVLGTLELARMLLMESVLSFLGLGVQPPAASWGSIMGDGRKYLTSAWWLVTFPGAAIMLVVLAVNLAGDGLRDLLDPRLRR